MTTTMTQHRDGLALGQRVHDEEVVWSQTAAMTVSFFAISATNTRSSDGVELSAPPGKDEICRSPKTLGCVVMNSTAAP